MNPYIDRTKPKYMPHPLNSTPGFCRLDMSTKLGKSSLPEISKYAENHNDLVNEETITTFIKDAFLNEKTGNINFKIKKLQKKHQDKQKRMDLMLQMHPNLQRVDIIRSTSMKMEEKEIENLMNILKNIDSKNKFISGPVSKIINRTFHQTFFNKDFKLRTLSKSLQHLTESEKLQLLN